MALRLICREGTRGFRLTQVSREHILESAAQKLLHENFLVINLAPVVPHVIDELAMERGLFRCIDRNIFDLDFTQDLGRLPHELLSRVHFIEWFHEVSIKVDVLVELDN